MCAITILLKIGIQLDRMLRDAMKLVTQHVKIANNPLKILRSIFAVLFSQ